MVKVAKKPAPKVGKGGKVSKKGGKAKVKAGAKEAPLAEGSIVLFQGYSTERPEDEQMWKVGQRLAIVNVTDKDGVKTYDVVAEEDQAAYKENPDGPDGEELLETEIKRVSGRKALAKPEPEPIKVTSIGALDKMIKSAGDATSAAQKAWEEGKKAFFYFGGILAKILHENLDNPSKDKAKAWTKDREGWEKFCEDNFGIKPGKARGYIDIYLSISSIPGIDIERITKMGWSKAAEVSKYITAENAEEVIELAEKKPITELQATLKESYVGADGKTPSGRDTRGSTKMKKIDFKFQLWEDAAAGAKYILEAAGKQTGTDLNGAFEHILNEWASEHLDEAKVKGATSAVNKTRKALKAAGVTLPKTDEKAKEKAKVAA